MLGDLDALNTAWMVRVVLWVINWVVAGTIHVVVSAHNQSQLDEPLSPQLDELESDQLLDESLLLDQLDELSELDEPVDSEEYDICSIALPIILPANEPNNASLNVDEEFVVAVGLVSGALNLACC